MWEKCCTVDEYDDYNGRNRFKGYDPLSQYLYIPTQSKIMKTIKKSANQM